MNEDPDSNGLGDRMVNLPSADGAISEWEIEAMSLAAQVDSEWWLRNRERILRKIDAVP